MENIVEGGLPSSLRRHTDGEENTERRGRTTHRNDVEDELELKYGAEHVIRLFVPVSICMALVIFTMNTINYYSEFEPTTTLIYTPFQTGSQDATSTRILSSLGNALMMIVCIVVMTVVLILLYKYRCYKIIHGWLVVSSLMLLTIFTSIYVIEVFKTYNWCLSSPTVYLCLFNFAVLGMLCIHWKGPLILQQAYLIMVSALMALTFIKLLPDWTAWSVLGLVSIWDLIAVLCPKGPLNVLVKLAQERNEPIFPALIYSSGVLYMYTILMTLPNMVVKEGDEITVEEEEEKNEDNIESVHPNQPSTSTNVPSGPSSTSILISSNDSKNKRPQVRRVPPPPRDNHGDIPSSSRLAEPDARVSYIRTEEVEERGIKLGLGDFIFYSVLVGKASESYDWNTIVACYVAILVGLCLTLLLLAVFKKALPALPISIFAGLTFYFCTTFLITPFTSQVISHQLTY